MTDNIKEKPPPEIFDSYYYAHGCGIFYKNRRIWMPIFRNIAKRLKEDINPKTVLDAGCAFGYLVEAFREIGIDAWGIDISEYAISKVSNDIKPYCRVGSISEKLPQKYDLITCIEILEHMPLDDAEKAVVSMCRSSKDIFFSSTPFDYKEITHFNVHPPEYWSKLFAKAGYFRDVDYDGSFLTPWAVRYKYSTQPLHQLAYQYERKYWLLWKENVDLRQLNLDMRNEISGFNPSQIINWARIRFLYSNIRKMSGKIVKGILH